MDLKFMFFIILAQCVVRSYQTRLLKRAASDDCTTSPSVFNQTDKSTILSIHNTLRSVEAGLRSSSGMLHMKWNDELASRAQEWANTCQPFHGKTYRCGDNEPLGQNLYSISSNKNYNVPSFAYIMSKFDEEGAWYDSKTDTCTPSVEAKAKGRDCGHFTQLIWESTNEVGCGMSKCKRPNDSNFYTIFVCDYFPAGNVVTVNPITSGEPCSQCSTQPIPGAGYKCANNLCYDCMVGSDRDCKCGRTCEFGTLNLDKCTCECFENYSGLTCSESCGDLWGDRCPEMKNQGLCDRSHAFFPMMKINCPVTCGVAANC